MLPIPIFDHNGTTLMCASKDRQIATAKALAAVIGNPIAVLNTKTVHRYLFKDGTSIDWLTGPPKEGWPYNVVAFKSIVMGFFSLELPSVVARDMHLRDLRMDVQPDAAFRSGDVVICAVQNALTSGGAGFGFIIRKHALKIKGPLPVPFKGFEVDYPVR